MAIALRDDLPPRRFAWVTLGLLIANIAVFLLLQPSAFQNAPDEASPITHERQRLLEAEEFANAWGAIPCEVLSGRALADRPPGCRGLPDGPVPGDKVAVLALLTSMFLHGNVPHIVGNLWFLWVFGNNVEDRLGRAWFLCLYLVGGLVAAMGFVVTNPHGVQPLVGASGAIAAVMGAYLVFHPRGRILALIASAAFQVVYVPAAIVLVLFFVTQFMTPGEDVAWQAHVAGMVFGFLAALALGRLPSVRRRAELDAADIALRAGEAF